MKHKQYRLMAVLLIGLLTVSCDKKTVDTPCTDSLGCVFIKPSEPVRLGILQALSGNASNYGQMQVRMIQLAVDQRDGKLLGHPIDLQIEDSACSREGGTAAANRVALNLNTVAVIGTFCSASAETASSVISHAGMTMISGANSAPSLTSMEGSQGKNWQPGYFRVMFNGAMMARAAAFFAYQKLGSRKVSLLNDGSLYTSEFTSEFKKAIQALEGNVVSSASINIGDEDMIPVITALLQSQTECIFFPIYQKEALAFIRQFKATKGTENIVLIGGGALLTESFLQSCGEDCIGIYFTGPISPSGPASERLKQDYRIKYNENPEHSSFAHAFDAANLILSSIESVASTGQDGSLVIGRQALRDAIYKTNNFKAVTGILNCDQFGDCSADRYDIVQLENPRAGLEGLQSNIVYTYIPDQAVSQ